MELGNFSRIYHGFLLNVAFQRCPSFDILRNCSNLNLNLRPNYGDGDIITFLCNISQFNNKTTKIINFSKIVKMLKVLLNFLSNVLSGCGIYMRSTWYEFHPHIGMTTGRAGTRDYTPHSRSPKLPQMLVMN
ncbi:hypothetical protein HYC85_030553 [Camellia sinensis]|uniref:Uncharacterized protein n=1 Tax=Camellia sinensis TaxID=4442 RepID=A0A7J7G163_CAMSI|nr:hypothetical protein HYC85_030553 [Camellia sinensis]